MRRKVHRPRAGTKTQVDGYTFDSKAEAARYGTLNLRRLAGEIRDLEVHPRLHLVINGRKIGRGYILLDFKYEELRDGEWRTVYEDVKGIDTRESSVRRQVAEAIHGIHINVIQA